MSKRKDKDLLYQTYVTTDGKKVIAGCFEVYQTHGIPLEILFDFIQTQNSVPDWIDLYKKARISGMAHDRVIHLLRDAVTDGYDIEWSNVVISRLESIFGEKK